MDDQTSEVQLYIPTTKETKISVSARDINPNLERNIQRAVERKFGNKFFSFGHVRPGTIKILRRSIGNKIGASDFTGKINFNILFSCEVFLPQIGMEIDARVKSINKIGILAKSDSNNITVLLSKDNQTNIELFSEVMLETRIRARILDFRINSQNETIVVIGDLMGILQGVYQNYQLPRVDGAKIEVVGEIQPTTDIKNLYINYSDFLESLNSKSLMDPYSMFHPENYDMGEWIKIRRKSNWRGFKDYWHTVRSMVEDYELVHPSGGYNGKRGVAVLPFKCEPISRAFFKLWELFYRYREIINRLDHESDITVLNLGECPGGFIQATAHFRLKEHSKSNDTYYCYSLEPKDKKTDLGLTWECPSTKREFKRLGNKLNLMYGDHTDPEDLKKMLKDLKGVKADLITADGAFTHSRVYNYEEIVNYKIFFGEIAAAILNQKPGGSFVLKIFDILTNVTRQLLLLLNHYYSEIFITKPDFSRPASSEKYVICLGFKGVETSNQTEESLRSTILDLQRLWNEKIDNRTDIYYPSNETFLLSLLDYQVGDDEDFSRKLQEISRDHVMKQSEHITEGIHLIHTRSIFDRKKVEALKQDQLKQAINWCQRYKLDYLENLDLTDEQFIGDAIVNTMDPESYTLETVEKDHKETYMYLKDEYGNVNMDYLRERSLALNGLLQGIYQDYVSSEIYEFKTSRLNPAPVLNSRLNVEWSQRQYVVFEILSQSVKSPGKKYSAFMNLDSVSLDATQAMINFFKNKHRGTDFNWVGNVVWQNNMPDPTGMFKDNVDQWLMGPEMDGLVSREKTIEFFRRRFEKSKVDLYFSDFFVPLEEDAYGMLIAYPERYYMREAVGQIIAGLVSLKDGGLFVARQYTFFESISVRLITLLNKLFKSVQIVKPLAGPMETGDNYIIASGFNSKLSTDTLIDGLIETMTTMSGTREELMEVGEFPILESGLTDKEVNSTEEKLVYIAYRIYVLNQFPRLQINLDIFHNSRYALNSAEMATAKHMLDTKQELINKEGKLTQEDEQELIKIEDKMGSLFQGVTERIVREDFSYLIKETVDNWVKLYPIE